MDDSAYGTDDRRGNWVPTAPISYGPAFQWPPQPAALFKWFFGFPGYLLPGNTPFYEWWQGKCKKYRFIRANLFR